MASTRTILFVLFVCFFFSSYNIGVQAGRRFISKEEDIEFEKQLKLLNKPAIKSIQTEHGDIYDCVDFYKQPAFDHPLLKNHTFHPQMRPSSMPKLTREKELSKSKSSSKASYNGLERVTCPRGTVPIRRITKDDLIREKLHSERYNSKYSVLTAENPGTHYAVVQTKLDQKTKYNGGGARIGIYNPPVFASQYSSSRMKIQNGHENIQTGWMVNPTMYGDNRTRLFIYFEAGQSRCFGTRCPGFVIVSRDLAIDAVLQSSKEGGQQLKYVFLVYKDQPIGNWWLELTSAKKKIGFWPERLFTSLANSATSVQWGGEVFSPPDVPSPQMGTGHIQYKSSNYVAHCEGITTINEANQIVNAVNTEKYNDVGRYDSIDAGVMKGSWLGHVMFFGGLGGELGN